MSTRYTLRYFEPLRLPIQPAAISSPYTRRLIFLKHHYIGSPALDCLSSATCRPCYPGRSHGLLPFPKSAASAFPICPLGRHLLYSLTRLPVGFTCVTACCFANWKLTTPCYQDAAPLNYRGESDNPPDGTLTRKIKQLLLRTDSAPNSADR